MSNDPAQDSTAAAPRFRLSYDLTFADYRALQQAKRALNPAGRALWRWRYPLIVALALAGSLAMSWHEALAAADLVSADLWLALAPVLLGLVVALVLIDLLFDQVLGRWVYGRFALANQNLTVEVGDDRLTWTGIGISGSMPWSRIVRFVELRTHVFLFISQIEAIGFPQRAFGSAEEFASFARYAKEKVHG